MKTLLALAWVVVASTSAMANEDVAKDYCIARGGATVTLASEDGAHHGFCGFGRALIYQETLWRHAKGQKVQAVYVFLDSRVQSWVAPASAVEYCFGMGGMVKVWRTSKGREAGICHFADGSAIEQWTLHSGSFSEDNEALVVVLMNP